jgi:hypothetical protein
MLLGCWAVAMAAGAADVRAEAEVKLLDGQIADVDWVGSSIDVRWLNPLDDQYREKTYKITSNVKIVRGHDSLDLSDLNRGDQLTIAYKIDPETGEEIPMRITVLVTGTLPPNS